MAAPDVESFNPPSEDDVKSLRGYLQYIAEPVDIDHRFTFPVDPFADLRPFAMQVASKLPFYDTQDAADELASELVLRLTARPADAEKLLALDDQELKAALHHRLQQVGVERSHAWGILKGLREKVVAALEKLPEPPAFPPATLVKGDDVQTAAVAAATASLLAQDNPPPAEPSVLARLLLARYFPRFEALDDAYENVGGSKDIEHGLLRRIQRGTLLTEIHTLLGDLQFQIVLRRWSGQTGVEIARVLDVSEGTVSTQMKTAGMTLAAWAAERTIGESTVADLFDRALMKALIPAKVKH